jgi:hypothetical protein
MDTACRWCDRGCGVLAWRVLTLPACGLHRGHRVLGGLGLPDPFGFRSIVFSIGSNFIIFRGRSSTSASRFLDNYRLAYVGVAQAMGSAVAERLSCCWFPLSSHPHVLRHQGPGHPLEEPRR